jgi:hypothetical protein
VQRYSAGFKKQVSEKKVLYTVGQCKLNPFDPWLESAWFKP